MKIMFFLKKLINFQGTFIFVLVYPSTYFMVLINFFPRKSLTSKIYNHKTALVVACYVLAVMELCLAVMFRSVVVVAFESEFIIFHGTFIFAPVYPHSYFMVLINFFPNKSLTSKICNHKTALAVMCYILR
jgi:hypothetical protein